MPRVRFCNVGLEIEVPLGATILEAAERAGAPEGTHCGGVCACSKCHVHVLAGAELLSPPSPEEDDMLDLGAVDRHVGSRLGCQARLEREGLCQVDITEESFQAYLDRHPADRQRALELWLARPEQRRRL